MKSSTELTVPLGAGTTTAAIVYPADGQGATLILGHGAGAGQRHPFMVAFATAIAARGIGVVTFNFPYMQQKRRVPDKGPVLEDCYARVLEAVVVRQSGEAEQIFIGGKSMGGRIATQLAARHQALPISGLVLLGYPLHPPGRPDQLRDEHLPAVGRPMLFIQGSRDAFGTPAELAPVLGRMTPRPLLHVVDGGDHSFKVPRANPLSQEGVYEEIQAMIAAWIRGVIERRAGVR